MITFYLYKEKKKPVFLVWEQSLHFPAIFTHSHLSYLHKLAFRNLSPRMKVHEGAQEEVRKRQLRQPTVTCCGR